MKRKDVFLTVISLFAISMGAGIGWNLLLSGRSAWSKLGGHGPAAAASERVFRIGDVGFDDLQKWLSIGNVVLLDARNVSEFRIGHLPGAWSVPANASAQVLAQMSEQLGREAVNSVVVYCSSSSCDDADRLATRLVTTNITKQIFIYRGGWADWRANAQ